jgi:bifunctional ADP-heptose synthase (sugar kinase/adenylyltransferase)
VFFHHQKNVAIIPAHIRNIADVSGAGDTVISVLALGLASQLTLNETVEISNLAGGLVCESPGVISITTEKLLNELEKK